MSSHFILSLLKWSHSYTNHKPSDIYYSSVLQPLSNINLPYYYIIRDIPGFSLSLTRTRETQFRTRLQHSLKRWYDQDPCLIPTSCDHSFLISRLLQTIIIRLSQCLISKLAIIIILTLYCHNVLLYRNLFRAKHLLVQEK